ncbi:hypothetical protein [Bdellovibrio sp. BCCA]|uniref:hypothetical protein n=1 Tax=Bdellovibrio sp. BCCA TaxID=3136281 RepID=UPI0030F215C6
MMSSLKSLFVASIFGFGLSVQANEIIGGQAPEIKAHQLNESSLAELKKKCDPTGMLTMPTKAVCNEVIGKSFLTQEAFDYCQGKGNLGEFVECVKNLSGRDYPFTYVEACKKVHENNLSSVKKCLDYLAQVESSFDSEGFKFCLEANDERLHYAKPCINAIRDRQVDVQKIKRACIDERSMGEKFDDCVFRLTDKAPSVASCVKKTPTSPSAPTRPGTR